MAKTPQIELVNFPDSFYHTSFQNIVFTLERRYYYIVIPIVDFNMNKYTAQESS